MNTYTVGHRFERTREDVTLQDASNIKVIGHIDIEGFDGKYPMPLFSIDKPKILWLPEASTTRIVGLLRANEFHFISGNFSGEVDIRGPEKVEHGSGNVYLSNGTYPSSTTGYIYENPLQFNPEYDLAYVHASPFFAAIEGHTFETHGQRYDLIYQSAKIIQELGQLSLR